MNDLLPTAIKLGALFVTRLLQSWRRVRVVVHRGYVAGNPQHLFFVTVTNLSSRREGELGRIWFASVPPVEVLAQSLPRRLKTEESWATWIPVEAINSFDLPYAESRFRVRLSNGTEVPSCSNPDPAPMGYIPGVN